MQQRPSLERAVIDLFDAKISLARLVDAFEFTHDFNGKHFRSTASVTMGQEQSIEVRGCFACENALPYDAGTYFRRYYKQNGIIRAHHANIEVAPTHQEHKLATTHYARLLRLYYEAGVVCIKMEADRDGPSVWPGFGFTLVDPKAIARYDEVVRSQLHQYVTKEEADGLLRDAQGFTPYLAAITVRNPNGGDDIPIGILAMRQLQDERLDGAEIKMTSWLDSPKGYAYLIKSDILDP